MIRFIMHGCNGKMGQVISNMVAEDPEIQIVAGVDRQDDGHNPYPVFSDISECNVEADVLIDFTTASAVDKLLDHCVAHRLPCVLCTTGLSGQQLAHQVKRLLHRYRVDLAERTGELAAVFLGIQ